MYTKVIIPFALVALTFSAHAKPFSVRRSDPRVTSTIIEKRAESGDAIAAAPDAVSAHSLRSILDDLDPVSAASELISEGGSALEAGASGMASLIGLAPTSNNASATSASSGDSPDAKRLKRDNIKREPLGLEDLTGALGGAGGQGKADAGAGGNAGRRISET